MTMRGFLFLEMGELDLGWGGVREGSVCNSYTGVLL